MTTAYCIPPAWVVICVTMTLAILLISLLPKKMKSKLEIKPNDCWLWTGARSGYPGNDYGCVRDPIKKKNVRAHRFVWETLCGPIDPGMELDHLCRNRMCCFPGHLEVVTPQENSRRAAGLRVRYRCKWGHQKEPYKACKTCNIMKARKHRQKMRENGYTSRGKLKQEKTHCIHGHPWTTENILPRTRGQSYCRICRNEQRRQKRRTMTEAAKANMPYIASPTS